jgi:hypothetical protein
MSQSSTVQASKITATAPATKTSSTKDAGRVHVGGSMMRFASSTKDAGRVHVGGSMMRF